MPQKAAACVERRLYETIVGCRRRRRPNAKIVNLKTAKASGLATPPTIAKSIRAAEVAVNNWCGDEKLAA